MEERLISAGFGGQGVLFIGKLLIQAGMKAGKEVSWIPSYGPEMRGGTANCHVIVSDEEIGSPLIDHPTSVIAMNRPSMEKFAPKIKKGGLLVINSSMVDVEPKRKDIQVVKIRANDVARELGNEKVANMVAMGAYLAASRVLPLETIMNSLPEVLKGKEHLLEVNKNALKKGFKLGEKHEP